MIANLVRRFRPAVNGTGVFAGYDSTFRVTQGSLAQQSRRLVDPRERYAVLWAYYRQNNLYDTLARGLYEAGLWDAAIKPLRNPAYRIAEAYPAHLWPGDLPAALAIQTDNERIIEPIHQLWRWSNWASNKQVFARWLAVCGDVFVKVVRPTDPNGQRANRVYFQLIDPAHISDFDTDERGNLTYCRIEVPQWRRDGDKRTSYTHVEIWSKAEQTYRRWAVTDAQQVLWADPDRPPPPDEEITLAQMDIDFVPVVHCKFLDVGEPRGVGAYLLQLDKIDEVNRQATRLAQMLYRHNQALWALHGMGNDASGRPLPPPVLPGQAPGDDTAVEFRDNQIVHLPGSGQLTPLVPNLHYEAHRLVNNDGLLDLQRDCPEMAWAQVLEGGASTASGRSLRFQLAPFEKRLREVRGNAEDVLARLDAMGLTLGSLEPRLWSGDVGSFDQGDYEHQFADREVIPLGDLEEAQAAQQQADAAQKKLAAGWSQRQVWRDAGLDDAAIEQMEAEKATVDVLQETEL